MQTREVKGLAGVGQVAVMLLEDLVEAGEVEVDVLLEFEELLGRVVDGFARLLADRAACSSYGVKHFTNLFHLFCRI